MCINTSLTIRSVTYNLDTSASLHSKYTNGAARTPSLDRRLIVTDETFNLPVNKTLLLVRDVRCATWPAS